MKDLNKYRIEIIEVLETIKEDADMAIQGEWDCSTPEGREAGFEAQIILIDRLLKKIGLTYIPDTK